MIRSIYDTQRNWNINSMLCSFTKNRNEYQLNHLFSNFPNDGHINEKKKKIPAPFSGGFIVFTMALDSRYKYPVAASNGNNTMTHNKLNISCTVAPAKALRNWFLSPICPIATMVLVTLVPIFAPITIGIAGRTSNTK